MKFISVQTHHCCITYSLLFNSKAGCIVYCTMGLLEIKIVLPDWCSVPVTLVRQYSLLYEFEHILFFLKQETYFRSSVNVIINDRHKLRPPYPCGIANT